MKVKPGEMINVNGTYYVAGDELPSDYKPKEAQEEKVQEKPKKNKFTKNKGGF